MTTVVVPLLVTDLAGIAVSGWGWALLFAAAGFVSLLDLAAARLVHRLGPSRGWPLAAIAAAVLCATIFAATAAGADTCDQACVTTEAGSGLLVGPLLVALSAVIRVLSRFALSAPARTGSAIRAVRTSVDRMTGATHPGARSAHSHRGNPRHQATGKPAKKPRRKR